MNESSKWTLLEQIECVVQWQLREDRPAIELVLSQRDKSGLSHKVFPQPSKREFKCLARIIKIVVS